MQAYLLPCGVAQCWQMWKGLERVGWCWLCGWGSFSARCFGSGRTNRSCYRLRALGSSVADGRPPPSPQVAVHSRAARIHPHSQSWVGTQCAQEQRAVESKHSLAHGLWTSFQEPLCRSALAEIVYYTWSVRNWCHTKRLSWKKVLPVFATRNSWDFNVGTFGRRSVRFFGGELGYVPPALQRARVYQLKHRRTVDGRNLAAVDSQFIQLFIGFRPSKVVQDFFFHPQYFRAIGIFYFTIFH